VPAAVGQRVSGRCGPVDTEDVGVVVVAVVVVVMAVRVCVVDECEFDLPPQAVTPSTSRMTGMTIASRRGLDRRRGRVKRAQMDIVYSTYAQSKIAASHRSLSREAQQLPSRRTLA
jgi:hypothetical protein